MNGNVLTPQSLLWYPACKTVRNRHMIGYWLLRLLVHGKGTVRFLFCFVLLSETFWNMCTDFFLKHVSHELLQPLHQ